MCAFPRNGMLAAHIDPKHCCWFLFFLVFVKFCEGSNIGLLRGRLEVCGQAALLF